MHGWCEKGDFSYISYGYRRLYRKRCDIGRLLLWNVNRNSWVPDLMLQFSMTVSNPQPRFQGHCILGNRICEIRYC